MEAGQKGVQINEPVTKRTESRKQTVQENPETDPEVQPQERKVQGQ